MLLTITVGALAFGWYANRALRQRAAVAAILRQGGRIYYAHNDPLRVNAQAATPPPLAGLLGVDFVDTVTVAEFIGPEFDDADLVWLDALPAIHWLRIHETKLTGASFQHVSRCRQITALVINGSPLQDVALPEIGRMQQLGTLHLVDTRITDAELHSLSNLTGLNSLTLSGCAITDAGLASCALAPTIRELSLENTRVGDAGITQLQQLPLLGRLSLYGSQVSDAGVVGLSQIAPLRSVMLGSTHVTNDGLRQLRDSSMPWLYISPSPNDNP
jgi:Leucine-rich repeat (LRR) protein